MAMDLELVHPLECLDGIQWCALVVFVVSFAVVLFLGNENLSLVALLMLLLSVPWVYPVHDAHDACEGKVLPSFQWSYATILCGTTYNGHINVVQHIIDQGHVDVNEPCWYRQRTALMAAATNGRVPLVNMLLEAGARKDIKDSDGHDALWYATSRGHHEVMTLLAPDHAANGDQRGTNNKNNKSGDHNHQRHKGRHHQDKPGDANKEREDTKKKRGHSGGQSGGTGGQSKRQGGAKWGHDKNKHNKGNNKHGKANNKENKDPLWLLLHKHGLAHCYQALHDVGVVTPADMEFLEPDDIAAMPGLKKVARRKLRRLASNYQHDEDTNKNNNNHWAGPGDATEAMVRIADHMRAGKEAMSTGDCEGALVEYAAAHKVATQEHLRDLAAQLAWKVFQCRMCLGRVPLPAPGGHAQCDHAPLHDELLMEDFVHVASGRAARHPEKWWV